MKGIWSGRILLGWGEGWLRGVCEGIWVSGSLGHCDKSGGSLDALCPHPLGQGVP